VSTLPANEVGLAEVYGGDEEPGKDET